MTRNCKTWGLPVVVDEPVAEDAFRGLKLRPKKLKGRNGSPADRDRASNRDLNLLEESKHSAPPLRHGQGSA